MVVDFHKVKIGLFVTVAALCAMHSAAFAGSSPANTMTKRQYLESQNKEKVITPSERSCGMYLDQVDKIYKGARPKRQFRAFRLMYTRCTFYDPFIEETLRDMAEAREKAIGDDPIESSRALRNYKNIVRRHLVNLGVVNMALEIAKEDSRFGNPDFFREVRAMIIESLKGSFRDGSEPATAIEIVTMAEQDYIIANAGGKLLENELIKESGIYYYALDFEEEGTNKKFSIFLDVSTPMIVAQTRQQEAEKEQNLNVLGNP
ncbi:MAG: hypothetical protein KJ017_13590 [Alphaproteobacteria bacterium]|nr:hypothetical protein [Alphaproteobacteria bacterium]